MHKLQVKNFLSHSIFRNIFGAGGARVLSIAISIFSVPLLLRLIGKEQYGVWVTLTSLLAWLAMFDLGLGNSLRNSVATIVKTAALPSVQLEFLAFFRILGAIALCASLLLFLVAATFPVFEGNRLVALVLYVPVLLSVPFFLGSSVMQGARRLGLQTILQSSNTWLFFIFIALCQWFAARPSLIWLASVTSLITVSCTTIIFMMALRMLKIPLSRLFLQSAGPMPVARIKVGLSFLLLQIASVVLFSMGNVIIFGNLGAGEVARYDVINKIFQVGFSFYNIVMSVVWSEISRLRALNDFVGLRLVHFRMLIAATIFGIGAFAVVLVIPWVVQVWTGHIMSVNRLEALPIAALVCVQAFAYAGAVFLSAFEQIKIQVVMSTIALALMVPLSKGFFALDLGIAAVPLAATILTIIPMIVCNVKTQTILRTELHRHS